MAKEKKTKKKITDVNIQKTLNGYYVYSHEDFENSPRVFEDYGYNPDEDDPSDNPMERVLDYVMGLLNNGVSPEK